MSQAPTLTDGTVTLRAHTEDDLDAMVEMCIDPEMVRWTSVPQPYARENARFFKDVVVGEGWARDHRGWAIEATDDTGTARFAGNVDVRGVPVADVGFALHPWARGRGVMARALRLACRWSFDAGGVEVVHWRSHVGNVASWRVAWAAGFSFHGTIPRLLHERDRVIDTWVGSLLPQASGQPVTTWLEPVPLAGEHVRLRPFRDSDAPRVTEACRDERSREWLPGLPENYTDATAREFMLGLVVEQSLGNGVWWAVADPRTDELIANVSVMSLGGADPTSGEIGYWTHPEARGRGVMTEAVRLVVDYAFAPDGLALRRLSLGAADGNAASQHVALANGFTDLGPARQANPMRDGSFRDLVWYDLLVTDR